MSFERGLPFQQIEEVLAPLRRGLHARQGVVWLPAIIRPKLAAIVREDVPEPVGALLDEIDAGLAGALDADGLANTWASLCRLDALLGLPGRTTVQARVRRLDAGGDLLVASKPADGVVSSNSGVLDLGIEARIDALDLPAMWTEALLSAGVECVGDLVWCPLASADALGPIFGAGKTPTTGLVAVGGRVVSRAVAVDAQGNQRIRVVLQGAGPTAAWIAASGASEIDLLRALLLPGNRAVLAGTATERGLIDAWVVGDEPKATARAVHWGLQGVPDQVMRTALQRATGRLGFIKDALPESAIRALSVCSTQEAWAGAARGEAATQRRLAQEELLLSQLGLLWARRLPGRERGIPHALASSMATRVFDELGLQLSDPVALVLEAVKRDLRRPQPMRRILFGAAGAGQSRVALWAMLAVAESRAQVAVVAEDFRLVEEHFAPLEDLAQEVGLTLRLVPGAPTGAVREAMKRGELSVVFGTPALLDASVEWRRLGLVVSLERRAHGEIAKLLVSRSPRPDLLVLAGAPPGFAEANGWLRDCDLSPFPEPEVQLRVRVYNEVERSAAVGEIAEVLASGGRAIVIFPMVDGKDVFDRREAAAVLATLQEDLFPGRRLALYHGAMSRDERLAARRDLALGRIDILLSTTLIEEGPPIPGVRAVLIEQADRFDPVRLERLRRVVGASSEGRLVCVVGDSGDQAQLEAWVSALDVAGRVGPTGEVVTGPLPTLRWWQDPPSLQTLAWVRGVASEILADDPGLRRSPDLARALRARWADLWPGDEDEEGAFVCPISDVGAAGGSRKRRKRRRR